MTTEPQVSALEASDWIDESIPLANVPILLVLLVQLTGDLRWLEEPYVPGRGRGVSDNDSGELPPEIQIEIRAAARHALHDWVNGKPVAIPEPSDDLLLRLLGYSLAEPIPPEYGEMLREDYLLAKRGEEAAGDEAVDLTGAVPDHPVHVPVGFKAIIIGAGIAGLTCAKAFKTVGIEYTIFERNPSVGGTWYENRYPGAGVDTPNHLYCWASVPYDWKHYFSLRDDIQSYVEHVTDLWDLRSDICFATPVERIVYDTQTQMWDVTVLTPDGERQNHRANVVVSASGLFNAPKFADLPGAGTFKGVSFHTARWPANIDLTGKNVVVVGNGASAMQAVPAIAPEVARLTVFQRSAHWILPFDKFQVEIPNAMRTFFQKVPLYRWWYRARLMWNFNDKLWSALRKDPSWTDPERSINQQNDRWRKMFTRYIREELGDRADLVEKTLPTYPPFGKRMLLDNGWYRTLRRENVSLVDQPIKEVRAHEVIAGDGQSYPADVLIYATGFQAARYLSTFEVINKDGHSIRDVWDDDDARAYLGLAVPSLPNFFCIYGPNVQAGHGGTATIGIAGQVRYILSVLQQMFDRDIGSVACRQEVCEEYNQRIDDEHEEMIWSHKGMDTYYRNSKGRLVVIRPFRNIDFWKWTRKANLDDFIVEPRPRIPEVA